MNPADLSFLEKTLTVLSDQEYQLRVWCKAIGPEIEWFEERLLSFDTEMDYFRDLLRKGETFLTPVQVKAILRLHVMTLHFCDVIRSEDLPKDWKEEQLYIINHPYWQEIRKQAAYALQLLNSKDRETRLRTYGSIATRTATRHPKLDDRFADKMKIFASSGLRTQKWQSIDDFWGSVHNFDDVVNRFFEGGGMISNRGLYRAMTAFDKALTDFCEPYEGNESLTIEQLLSDPRFREVEQKAQDFLAIAGKIGSERRT